MGNQILIFDTTLRDGEQAPGCSMNTREKLEMARQLARLKVDVIEAGFAIASEDDFEAVKTIAQNVKGGPIIASLCRTRDLDIDRSWEALQYADRSRIHIFIATSEIHITYKLKSTQEEVLQAAIAAVKHARRYTDDVEFSPEDAHRSEQDFLCKVVEEVIKAGATTINIPDTVGYGLPWEFGARIKNLFDRVPNIDKAVISCHCHNDLGLAVANSLEAVRNGARQVECTINGIGERAGNASLEEIVMALRTRKDLLDFETGINTEEIYRSSKLLTSIIGIPVQPNKAIVGANAFAHEAGVHQHGMLQKPLTYEIMTPESVGVPQSRLVLGKHSGRHAFKKRLEELGAILPEEAVNRAFTRFKIVADKKKEVFDDDLLAIVEEEALAAGETYTLDYLQFTSGMNIVPTATVRLKRDNEIFQESGWGDGPVDAAYKAIDQITKVQGRLADYSIRAITAGKDALGEVVLKLEVNGHTVIGRGTSTDVIEASVRAYLNAVNKIVGAARPPKDVAAPKGL
ncbi:2-isopropylmalate synthase [Candidatus Methylomirabilis sp.]|uniref:2-isopropylmalate synthase n=1 Tax=Candidatus Methylomirabilis sp. TaxID=2032687 RepID=UPI002A61835A|nr:2-isopropylmalate synthase [Candidatus Methylomirabilis sp.]